MGNENSRMPLLQKYTRLISSSQKGCILFLLDQLAAMSERIAGSSERKCDLLAKAVNRWLEGTVIENCRDDKYLNCTDSHFVSANLMILCGRLALLL